MGYVHQNGFGAGEWDPALHQRTDLRGYDDACATLENFTPLRSGAAMTRPGMEFVGLVKVPAVGAEPVRDVPFVYSNDTSYVIELGLGYLRAVQNGAYVETSPGVPYEIEIPIDGSGVLYGDPGLKKLSYRQSGNLITIAHPSFPPYEIFLAGILGSGAPDFRFTVVSFDLIPFARLSRQDPVGSKGPAPRTLQVGDGSHPKKPWLYKVSLIGRRTDGSTFESAAFPVTQCANIDPARKAPRNRSNITTMPPFPGDKGIVVYPDVPFELNFDVGSGILGIDYEILQANIYRGKGGRFGLLPPVSAPLTGGNGYFIDVGDEPDYSQPPPEGRNPFKVYDVVAGRRTLVRTEDPTTTTFFQQRAVYGGTDERPNSIWMSAVNQYTNFDKRFVPLDENAIEIQPAATKRDEIRALVAYGDRLLVFTSDSVFSVGGDGAVGPVNLPPVDVQSSTGSSWLYPLVLGSSVLYVKAMGGGVRDLTFSTERGGYEGDDVAFRAHHLFRGRTVVSWCYAREPHGLIWVVLDDGTFLSLTYDRSVGVIAWAKHETDGTVEQVTSVPEGNEDAVYLVVVRDGVRMRERFATRVIDAAEDSICLDAAVVYDGAATSTITGLDHLEGETVSALADGNVLEDLEVEGGELMLPFTAEKVTVGLAYTCTLQTLPIAQTKGRQTIVKRIRLYAHESRAFDVGQPLEDGQPNADDQVEWQQRTVTQGFDALPLETRTAEVMIPSSWNQGGAVIVRQTKPLPLTVLGISREVEVGG